ncbi:MAG: energy-coupling factor ABC transporter permease [Planctomycetia bacterium]|nr:energy-coupling factor ABC transporter permease [Planctomycetia bacterium]
MHLPDGFLNASTCAGTAVVAGGALAWGIRQARAKVGDHLIPLLGVMSACVFSAQMVNFPILWGTSGHLVGGALAAIILGPWAGALAMTVVLIVQCLLFYDGGLTALGANVLNMAIAGSLLAYAPYTVCRRLVAGPSGHVVGASVAAWISVELAAAFCSIELWWSGTYPLSAVLPAMLIVHSAIGVVEALVTGMVVAFLLRVRPDLLYAVRQPQAEPAEWRPLVAAGLVVAVLVAFCLSPLASAAPDGLQRVAGDLGSDGMAPVAAAIVPPLADYQMPGLRGVWLATSLAGIVGALVVFALGWGLARGLRKRMAESG